MLKLEEKDIYLSKLERADCRKLWEDFEYDYDHPTELLNIGISDEAADTWFEEIQKLHWEQNIRLGIFLQNGEVIGDVALQDIDRVCRKCSIGMGIAKLKYRGKGFGQQATNLILNYGFHYVGMERITANTLDVNIGAQRALERCGFTLEGRERKSIYLNGEMHDRLNYAILKEEYFKI